MKHITAALILSIAITSIIQGQEEAADDSKTGAYRDGLSRWSPQGSVRLTGFPDADDSFGGGSQTGDIVVPSPQGDLLFFVSRHGDLSKDCNVYRLCVYAVADVDKVATSARGSSATWLKPTRCVTMEHPKLPAIAEARWVDGGDGIEFLGVRDANSVPQVYRLNIASGKLTTLTTAGGASGVQFYHHGTEGIIFGEAKNIEADPAYPIYSWSAQKMLIALTKNEYRKEHREQISLFASYQGEKEWRIDAKWGQLGNALALSPDGRYAVLRAIPATIPASWQRYVSEGNDRFKGSEFLQFMLLDLKTKVITPMFDAPGGWATKAGIDPRLSWMMKAMWSADSRHAILVNTALPLSGEDAKPEHASMAYIATYDIETHQYESLEPLESSVGGVVYNVEWLVTGKSFLVRHILDGKSAPGTIYTLQNAHWVPRVVESSMAASPYATPMPALQGGWTVKMRQSANDAPAIVASNGVREVALTEAEPLLQKVWMAKSLPFQWRDAKGVTRTSGLLLPRDLPIDGTRVPMVIQIGKYEPDVFHPDGPSTTAFAAQSLVARGIAVLNMDAAANYKDFDPLEYYPNMTRDVVDAIDSVAMAVAEKYPIDLERVGLVGFSATGHLVHLAVENVGKVQIAAAVSADAYQGSFSDKLVMVASGGSARSWTTNYGGPFYENKASWFDRETSFNVDRVRTPVLFTRNDERMVWSIGILGSFLEAKKPFECLVLPNGYHELRAPRQREASIQATVDWMVFWLQTKNPSDAERAARWAILRKQQDEVLKTPPPPKGKWVFVKDPVQPEWHPPENSKMDEKKSDPAAEPKKEPEPAGAGK